MKYSVEWIEEADNAAPEERATVGKLRLWLDAQNVTAHLLDDVPQEHVSIALYGIAHGLTHDWWALFGGRDRDVSLMRFRSGFIVPDIRLRFDGEAFEISARQRQYPDRGVRFWAGPSELLSRQDAEAKLTELIESILVRLDAHGLGETSAALRWDRVKASRVNGEAAFCEAAGALGLDPYEIDESSAAIIEEAEELFGGEALTEFIAGARGVAQERLLHWVTQTEKRPSQASHLPDLKGVAEQAQRMAPPSHFKEAWALGYRRARAMRRALGLGQEHRFRSHIDLVSRFGAGPRYKAAERIDGIRALRADRADGTHIHLRSHGTSGEAKAAQLFTLARAVGDAACFPETRFAPVNDLRSAYRQAAGRAFAAEFLAPIDEIHSMVQARRDIVSIADEFSLSTAVIEHQIENAPRIAEACALAG